jgi:hypothetical protein
MNNIYLVDLRGREVLRDPKMAGAAIRPKRDIEGTPQQISNLGNYVLGRCPSQQGKRAIFPRQDPADRASAIRVRNPSAFRRKHLRPRLIECPLNLAN